MSDTNNQLEINALSLENFVYQTIIEITKGIENATTELKAVSYTHLTLPTILLV